MEMIGTRKGKGKGWRRGCGEAAFYFLFRYSSMIDGPVLVPMRSAPA